VADQKKNDLAKQLSKRLQNVVALVKTTGTAADIGCDHGYVAISLIQQKKAEHVIAMDIGKGPLHQAKEHIIQYGMEDVIETRLSDGASALGNGEAQALICAGMGGPLMIGILERGSGAVMGMEELILQPQSEIMSVREWLRKNGYRIEEERMIAEDGKYYPMFRAVPGNTDDSSRAYKPDWEQRMEDRYGPLLLSERNAVLFQFLQKEERVYKAILQGLSENQTQNTEDRGIQVTEYLQDIEKVKKHYYADRSTV